MFKKLLVILLVCFSFIGLTAIAAEYDDAEMVECYGEINSIQHSPTVENIYPSISLYSTESDIEGFKEAVASSLRNFNATVNVYSYKIPTALLQSLLGDIINENPDLFFVKQGYRYGTIDGYVNSITFYFIYTDNDLDNKIALFNAETEKVLSLVIDDMTDLEKALVVHDYFAVSAEYNTPAANTGDNETYPEAWTAYGVLVDKIGVCQSYTLAYRHILNLLGIDSAYATSEDMNHIWNTVKIDGKWYHVDVTWDDPTSDRFGYTRHNYFMLSDTAIQSDTEPHYNYVTPHQCISTDLDDIYLKDAKGPVIVTDAKHYYMNGFNITEYDKASKNSKTIYKIKDKWFLWGSNDRVYSDAFSYLALYDGRLYFNTPTEIKTIKPDGTEEQTFFKYKDNQGYIYGILKDGLNLYYCISDIPTDKDEISHLPLRSIDATLNEGNISVTLQAPDEIKGELLINVYNSKDGVISSNIYDAEDNLSTSVSTAGGDYIRLMWWDLKTLKPYAQSYKLNI